jgi:hypothetical protein
MKFTKWIIVFCFLLNSATAIAQYSNTSWFFDYSRIDFHNQPASVKKSKLSTSGSQQFVITNCNGDAKIIAYGRGYIYNENEKVMKGSGYMGAGELYYLIDGFVYPGSKDSIVIFHDFIDASRNLCWGYSIVDLTKDSGRGEVIMSNVIVRKRFNPTMSIVKHANSLDYWILGTSDSFSAFAYHFSNKGLNPTPVLSSGVFNDYLLKNGSYDFVNSWACQAPFVPTWDSKQIIVTGLTKWRHATACALIYDFDNSTGKITNPQELFKRSNLINKTEYTTQKAAVSPNDSFIYLGVVHPNCLGTLGSNDFACFYQINRFTKTKVLLKTQFVNTDNRYGFHGTNVTPEGTICVIDYSKSKPNTLSPMWRVERPNLEGKSCKYTPWLTDYSSPGVLFPTVLNRIAPTYFTVNNQINSCTDTSIINIGGDTLLNKLVLRFGDGDTLLYTGPFKPKLTFKHFYKSNGNYPLTIVTWNKSCNTPRWLIDTLAIYKPPRNLEVNVTHNPTCYGDTVRVTLKAQNHQRYSVNWGFSKLGGGVYDTLLNSNSDSASFQFYYPETDKKYKLNFSATNKYCDIAKSDSIAVVSYPKPKNHYSLNLDSSCADKPLILSDSGILWRTTTIEWFGLRDTITGTNNLSKQHYLPNATSAQTASVFLTSSNVQECLLRDTIQVYILPRPNGSIQCLDSVICAKQQTFTVRIQKINQPTNTRWTWWDGSQKSNDSIWHKTYAIPGRYPILLIANTVAGCADTNTLLLTVKSLPKAAFSVNHDTLCYRKGSLQLVNFASCADDTISVHRFTTNKGDTLYANTSTISQPSIGKYTITHFVSTEQGCFDTLTKPVMVNASPNAAFQLSQSHICDGQFFIAISDSTGLGDSGYWDLPQLGISATVDGRNGKPQLTVTGKQTVNKSGRYTLGYYLINAEQCRDTLQRSITINRRPMANFTAPSICVGQEVNFYSNSRIGDAPLRLYQWINGLDQQQGTDAQYTFKTAGYYPITHIVSDTNDCTDTILQSVVAKPIIIPQISWAPSRYNNPTYTYEFSAAPEGMKEYNWTFEEAGNFQGINVFPSFGSRRDNIRAQLTITSPNGCVSDTTMFFNIMGITGFYFPNAITINRDGLNEGFGIAGPEHIKKYELQIYNKWGEMVFKTNNPNEQWMPENPVLGQYVYYCKVSDVYNRFKEIKGTVLLIQ